MDLQTLTAAYNGIKVAKDTITALLQLKIDAESKERVDAALVRLGAAQDTLFELREQLFAMQDLIRDLQSKVSTQDRWDSIFSKYQIIVTPGGGTVYESLELPRHMICPSCINKREIHILQDMNVWAGTFECPSCKTAFPIKCIPSD